MRILFGMILGAALTVAGAYSYDVLSGKAVNASERTTAAAEDRPMVNWDVVGRNWQSFETSVREMAQRVQDQFSKRSG